MTLSITLKQPLRTRISKRIRISMMISTSWTSLRTLSVQLEVIFGLVSCYFPFWVLYWNSIGTRTGSCLRSSDLAGDFPFVFVISGDGSHEEGSPSSPGTAPSPTSSPAMNHQGSGTNTTPSSTGTGAPATTPSDADERQKRTHRSSTDDSHPPKTPSQVAPVKPAPIKAPTKPVLTTPIKSSAAAGENDLKQFESTSLSINRVLQLLSVSHSTPNNSSPSSGSTMSNHISTPTTPQVNGAALGRQNKRFQLLKNCL